MATIEILCHNCSSNITATVGQSIFDNKLVWHSSYVCPNCGNQIEEDGQGIPPEKVRQAILNQEGEWGLVVAETGATKIQALSILQQALNLPFPTMGQLAKKIPGVATSGTRTEMEWLRILLSSKGMQTTINKITNSISGDK